MLLYFNSHLSAYSQVGNVQEVQGQLMRQRDTYRHLLITAAGDADSAQASARQVGLLPDAPANGSLVIPDKVSLPHQLLQKGTNNPHVPAGDCSWSDQVCSLVIFD